MKKKILCFILVMAMSTINMLAQTRIAVLPFTPDEKISKSAMSYLTEIFTVEMVNSRKFTVVERARLDAALKEMQMQSGDMFDESSAVELGKMAGAEMVFFGSIFRFGGKVLLSIKGMDIQTATLKYAKQEKGGSDSKLEAAVKLIAKQIINETVIAVNESEESMDTMERLKNKKVDKSIKYSPAETKVIEKYINEKWCISPDSREDMLQYYKQNKGIGIALVVTGPICILPGIIVTSLFCSFGNSDVYNAQHYRKNGDWDRYNEWIRDSERNFIIGGVVGANLITAGIIMVACCFYPFVLSKRIKNIYRKSTGQQLTFFDRMNLGGGYDWENKEVTVAMAIKL